MNQLLKARCIVLLIAVLAVTSTTIHAQASASATNAEVLQELERMRTRIQELETQLKVRDGAATGSTANAAADAPATATAAIATEDNPAKSEPFAFADWTWLTGNPRTKTSPLETKYFTPEIRVDVNFTNSLNHPKDDTIGGSSEIFRSGEVQLTQFGIGGDLHYENVRGRLMTQLGLYSQTTPRNDASPGRGQWNLDNAYRYVTEAYGGYHWDVKHGLNVDA